MLVIIEGGERAREEAKEKEELCNSVFAQLFRSIYVAIIIIIIIVLESDRHHES